MYPYFIIDTEENNNLTITYRYTITIIDIKN